MANRQLVDTSTWYDSWFDEQLDNDSKLLFLHLLINPNGTPAGIFELNKHYLRGSLGIKNINDAMKKLEPKVLYDAEKNLTWIVNYYDKNKGMNPDKMRRSVENTLEKYKSSFLSTKFIEFYDFKSSFSLNSSKSNPYITLNKGFNDNENDNENENKNKKEEHGVILDLVGHVISCQKGNTKLKPKEIEMPITISEVPTTKPKQKLDFEKIYQNYPRKAGKTKGIQKCNAMIKNESSYNNLVMAVANYSHITKNTETQFIKHFGTFMGCWQDYIEIPESELKPDCMLIYQVIAGNEPKSKLTKIEYDHMDKKNLNIAAMQRMTDFEVRRLLGI